MTSVAAVEAPADTPLRVAVVTSLFTIGPLAFLIMPALFEGLAERFHWSEGALGELATIELSGMALTSWSGLYWQHRWNWRVLSLAGIGLIVSANLAATALDDFALLAAVRFVAGFGGGILVSLYFAYLPSTRRPDRNGSIATFLQVAAQVVVYHLAPGILDRWGLSGLYGLIALAAAALIPFVGVIPKRAAAGPASPSATPRPSARGIALVGLFAGGVFYVTQAGAMSFLAEFGRQAAGLPVDAALAAIGSSAIAGLLGPAGSYLLGTRVGFLAPIAASVMLQIGLLFLLGSGGYGYVGFLVIVSLLQIAWNFILPYIFAVMVAVDEGLVVAMPGAQALGIALGPGIIGYAIETGGAGGGIAVGIGVLVLFFLMILPMCLTARDGRADIG